MAPAICKIRLIVVIRSGIELPLDGKLSAISKATNAVRTQTAIPASPCLLYAQSRRR